MSVKNTDDEVEYLKLRQFQKNFEKGSKLIRKYVLNRRRMNGGSDLTIKMCVS